jgi:hypothetical protein
MVQLEEGKVQNVKGTHGSEGATESGLDGPMPVGLAHFQGSSAPHFLSVKMIQP